MATDRIAKYAALPQKLKDVDAALREMAEVITGGTFDPDKIWGAAAEDNVTAYMESLNVDADLKGKINDLLGGLPGSSAINSAIAAATNGLQSVVSQIESTANEIGSEVDTRFVALKALMTPHQPNDYAATDGNYGFFPAIASAVTAGAASGTDVNAIMGPLNDVMNVVNAGQSIVVLTAFASGCIDLLGEALTIS
jgi:hypothetical protein